MPHKNTIPDLRGRLLPALALALLAGCAGPTYKYAAPTTPMGQACTMNCSNLQAQCKQREDNNAQQCEWRKQQAQQSLDQCKANTDDAMKCNQQVPFCFPANYTQCDSQYRECYQGCGGTVTEEKPK
jgi:hypothetical protein